MKKLLAVFMVSLTIGLYGCSSNLDPEASRADSVEQASKNEPNEKELQVASILNERLKTTCETRFSKTDRTYYVRPVDQTMIDEINQTLSGTKNVHDWVMFVSTLKGVSEAIYEELGADYTILVENPYDATRFLVTIYDGKILSDVVAEEVGYKHID